METSDILQGSILGPVLINIFVGDMDSGIECTLSKSANEAKLSCVVDTLEERDAIQKDLDRVERGLCNPQEVQQGQVQGPAPGSRESQTRVQAGQRMDWEQPWGEGLGGAGWWEAQHDSAMCAHSPEGSPAKQQQPYEDIRQLGLLLTKGSKSIPHDLYFQKTAQTGIDHHVSYHIPGAAD